MKSEKKKSGSRMKEKAETLLIRLWIEKEAECLYKLQSLKRFEERIRQKSRRGDRCSKLFHAHFRKKKKRTVTLSTPKLR